MNIYFISELIIILSLSLGKKHPIFSENEEKPTFSPNLLNLARFDISMIYR